MRRSSIALCAMIIIGLWVTSCSTGRADVTSATTSSTSSAATSSTSTPETIPSAVDLADTVVRLAECQPDDSAQALAAIDSYYSALNAGDIETARSIVTHENAERDARLAKMLPIAVDGLHSVFTHYCTLAPELAFIKCTEVVTDDLYGPAGINNESTVCYWLQDGKLRMVDDSASGCYSRPFMCEFDPTGDSLRFLMEFRVWAAESHPELESYWHWGDPIDSVAAIPCTVYPFLTVEAATMITGIVPEFVAQSDHWPVDSD